MIRDAASNTELTAALKASIEGDEVLITGEFPVVVRGVLAPGRVTIRALSKLTTASVRECSDLVFSDVMFTGLANPQLLVLHSKRVFAEDSVFMGDPAQPLDKASPALPLNGAWFRWCQDVGIQRSHFRYQREGVYLHIVDGATIEDSTFFDMHGDSVRGGTDCSKLTIRGNHIKDTYVHGADHLDGIQLWTKDATKPLSGILIEGNMIERGKGNMAPQGIFLRGTSLFGFPDAVIRKNAMLGTSYAGISIEAGGPQVVIEDNFIQAVEGAVDVNDKPINRSSLTLRASTGGLVRRNAAMMTPYQNLKEAEYVDNFPAPPMAKPGDETLFREWVMANLDTPLALKAQIHWLEASLREEREAKLKVVEENSRLQAIIATAKVALEGK